MLNRLEANSNGMSKSCNLIIAAFPVYCELFPVCEMHQHTTQSPSILPFLNIYSVSMAQELPVRADKPIYTFINYNTVYNRMTDLYRPRVHF